MSTYLLLLIDYSLFSNIANIHWLLYNEVNNKIEKEILKWKIKVYLLTLKELQI